jgi:hypothetical protein
MSLMAMAFSACNLFEKKEENPKPEEPKINGDTIAVKTGKGFSQLLIVPRAAGFGANGGFDDGISLFDMTIKPDGSELYLGVSTRTTTQQDPLVGFSNISLNLSTLQRTDIPLSSLIDYPLIRKTYRENANPIGAKSAGYRNGTTKMFFGSWECDNFGICRSAMAGDFIYNRTNTFSSTPRVTDDGDIIEHGYADYYATRGSTWGQRIFGAMIDNFGTQLWMQSIRIVPNKESAIFSVAFEPKVKNSLSAWFCGASSKKIYIGEVEFSASNVETPIQYLDSLDLPAGFSTAYSLPIQTRYSADKSKMAILISNGESNNKVCSFVFQTASKKLSRNIDNLTIPDLSSRKIDIDMDEDGNLYFDGWADNFRSDSTISIYKASGNSITSIGEDLLKSGSIKGIKFLNGKVYAAVVYAWFADVTNPYSKAHRLALIKQD